MNEKVLKLTDGSTITAKVNFATIYYMQRSGLDKLLKDKENPEKELSDDEKMHVAAQMIYILMRSNGMDITFDDALVLCPADTDSIMEVFAEFKKRLSKFVKKKQRKTADHPALKKK